MTKLAEAFASFGASGKNPRWSWSARSADGKTVVMTLWKDGFDYSSRPPKYRSVAESGKEDWLNRPGNKERRENLEWALENCGGMFRVVIVVAEDERAEPRKIKSSYPQRRMWGKITRINADTGEFEAVILDENSAFE